MKVNIIKDRHIGMSLITHRIVDRLVWQGYKVMVFNDTQNQFYVEDIK